LHRARGTAPGSTVSAQTGRSALAETVDVGLGATLKADAPDQIELRFEKVDVAFLIGHQLLEQLARRVVLDVDAIGSRLLIERLRANLGREIRFNDLPDVFADPQRIEHLEIGMALEEDDAIDEPIADIGLIGVVNEGDRRVHRYVFPRHRIRTVVRLQLGLAGRLDLVFTPHGLVLVRTNTPGRAAASRTGRTSRGALIRISTIIRPSCSLLACKHSCFAARSPAFRFKAGQMTTRRTKKTLS